MKKSMRSKSDVNLLLNSHPSSRQSHHTKIDQEEDDSFFQESFPKVRLPDRDIVSHDVFGRRRYNEPTKLRLPPSHKSDKRRISMLPLSQMDDEDNNVSSLYKSQNMKQALQVIADSKIGKIKRSQIAPLAIDILKSSQNVEGDENFKFSTTMNALQAAATIETLCRDIFCIVKRISTSKDTNRSSIKLKVCRPGSIWGSSTSRRAKAYILIREYDMLRTDVEFFRTTTHRIFDSSAFNSLAEDIRWRFQREWPVYVDALYVRVPG